MYLISSELDRLSWFLCLSWIFFSFSVFFLRLKFIAHDLFGESMIELRSESNVSATMKKRNKPKCTMCEREQNNEPMRFFVVVAFVFFYIFFFRNEFAPVFFFLFCGHSHKFDCLFVYRIKHRHYLTFVEYSLLFESLQLKKKQHISVDSRSTDSHNETIYFFFLIFAHFSELATVSVWVKETISCAFQEE